MKAAAALLAVAIAGAGVVSALAQQQAEPTPGVAEPAARPPEGPAPSAAAAERGGELFAQACAACHGATARGGPGGSPDLTASAIAMANDGGRRLSAFLAAGRPERGMPPYPVTEEQAANLSARLRAFGFAVAQPTPGVGAAEPPPVLVGDVRAGRAYFNGPVGRCDTCHAVVEGAPSPAASLAHIATKYPDPKALQNNMILTGRRFYWSPANSRDVTAAVTFKDGRTLTGYLSSVSDFKVIIRDEAGRETVIDRAGGEPKVALTDRMQAHLDLLPVYRDNDIHDLTAYLATLK